MQSNKNARNLALALAASASLFSGASQAFDLTGQSWVQYGDAQSYSLPVLAIQNGCTTPGCSFYVPSDPGAIKGLTVLGTGASGQQLVNNFSGMDNAYATPNGTNSAPFWRPDPTNYQGTLGAVNNNGTDTWDSSLAALKSYLAGESMVFFFNNNQTSSGGAFAQSLAAWARITVKNASGQAVGTYDLTNRGISAAPGGKYDLFTNGGGGTFMGSVSNYSADTNVLNPVTGDRTSTDYVLSGGQVCLTSANAPIACSSPLAVQTVNHNLGANQAAYALVFPELNAQLNSLFGTLSAGDLANYTMSVDVRLGCDPATVGGINGPICNSTGGYGRNLNSGYEQIFISTARDVTITQMPEPATIALAGLALFAAGWARRRQA